MNEPVDTTIASILRDAATRAPDRVAVVAGAAALDRDGWLRTGDLVSMDERGYLRVTGRLKEMIVTGGVSVYPVEIEAVIGEHPAVANVAVIGMPDARWGESVVAVMQLRDGADPDVAPVEPAELGGVR